jgi:hypothetical protein
MPKSIHVWRSSVGCALSSNETFRDVKSSGNNVRGRIVRGCNVWGRIVPVPWVCPRLVEIAVKVDVHISTFHQTEFYIIDDLMCTVWATLLTIYT